MHVLLVSLLVALVVCVLLLGAFWLFTISPLGRRIEARERRSARLS
jgi:branched-subunit amino acid ABC-type transport system permease component